MIYLSLGCVVEFMAEVMFFTTLMFSVKQGMFVEGRKQSRCREKFYDIIFHYIKITDTLFRNHTAYVMATITNFLTDESMILW